jgi:ribonucleoside-diphosphate reductase beta chain
MTQTTHEAFVTTSERGLRHDILPMRLYHKAKKLGVWDPRAIDFTRDQADWQQLNDGERETLLYLSALFQAGEESVTLDLLPLMLTIAREGRLEEEMYLTTFLWEEAKHTEFFRRFLDEVAHEHSDLHRYHTPSYRKIFYEELPQRMNALLSDPSPAAQARASAVYNMIVEGVLAETGYHAYFNMLERLDIMPGLREGVSYLKRDESRHLAYGVFLLSRLVAQDQTLWEVIESYMQDLLTYALGVINELFEARAASENPPFELDMQEYLSYATSQFMKRLERIRRARGQTLEDIYQTTEELS